MSHHLIFFDASCPLCTRFVLKLLKFDKKKKFLFAPLQGKTANDELKGHRAYLKNQNSMVLIENYGSGKQKVWLRGRGSFRIFWLLGGFWRLLGWLCFFPFGVDYFYRIIARHRHSLFLAKNLNVIPNQKSRFLP